MKIDFWLYCTTKAGFFSSFLVLAAVVWGVASTFNRLMRYAHPQYTPAIDIWSIGCIFAEMLTGKPLFLGRNVVHHLDLVTDLLGSPSVETIARIRNDKARRYLNGMPNKTKLTFSHKFPNADPLALSLLERLLAFDPVDRISAEEISFSKTLFHFFE
ncbi:hypothetical protein L1887_29593 [Cichorium endivia]|nr:hypothetical protein L1887_29593 [Cichorium endivia]